MITFNNIVERFKIFAENHFFIETFSFGSPDDVDLTKFTSFPLMHLVYTGATYDPGTKTYNLEIYILDVPADKTAKVDRQKEVVSDAEQCAEDIIADIKNGGNIFLFAQDYEVVNATTTPLEEETKNVLSGVLLDLSVSIPYEWDACNAPIDGVEPGGTEVTYARRGILRMLTLDGATDVSSVRTIKVTNGTLTDDGDGVVTLDTGGVDTLAGLTDVDVTGVTDGQVLKYDDDTGEWQPANDQSATSLGNLDDVSITTPADRESLIYDSGNWVNDNLTKSDVGLGNVDNTSDADKPISSATQTALNAKADTSAVPTELNDLSDVTITGTPSANEALIFDTATSSFKSLPNFTNRFEDEAENNKPATPFGERVYTVKADGDGIFIDAQSDTPTSGKKIERKIYHKAGFLESGDAIGDFTLIHTFADDTAYSATTSTFEGFRDGDTYGTPPFTLLQTWEETTAAPAFTGLLNESYGSGAAAAYSVRRLNGNYTGAAIEVERSSDNTTQDIGFDANGDLDESALSTFCSGTTGKVRTWYDQSQTGGTGSGNDAVQTLHTKQPTIYTGGAIVKESGRVALQFNGVDDGYSITAVGAASSKFAFITHTIDANDTTWALLAETTSTDVIPLAQSGSGAAGAFGYTMNNLYNAGATISPNTRGDIYNAYRNEAHSLTSIDFSGDAVGVLFNRNGFVMEGKAQEVVLYTSDKSTDRADIEENIGDYFTQNTPLLDTYTGAAAAYSLRKLRTAYSGSAIRVRRSNDNAETDIGFNVFGELDTVSLAAHCGSNDGFVKTWYDQSGNANDATQTTAANQPKIYDSVTGVVNNPSSSKPALFWNNNERLINTSLAASGSMSAFTTARISTKYRDSVIDSYESTSRAHVRIDSIFFYFKDAGSASTAIDTHYLLSSFQVSGTSKAGFVNGSSDLSNSNSDAAFDGLSIGSIAGNPNPLSTSFNFGGYIDEIVIYNSDQSANRTGIESNINTFYSIY